MSHNIPRTGRFALRFLIIACMVLLLVLCLACPPLLLVPAVVVFIKVRDSRRRAARAAETQRLAAAWRAQHDIAPMMTMHMEPIRDFLTEQQPTLPLPQRLVDGSRYGLFQDGSPRQPYFTREDVRDARD